MNEVIAAFISSLGSSESGNPTLSDYATKAFNQSTAGKAYNAFNQPDATMSSVYDAAQPTSGTGSAMQAPTLQQGVLGAQQPTFTQNEYIGGIPSLLQGYGQTSQGLLPFFGAR
jgi:hypothetical protein